MSAVAFNTSFFTVDSTLVIIIGYILGTFARAVSDDSLIFCNNFSQ